MRSMGSVRGVLVAAILVGVAGCVYQVVPATYSVPPPVFDRSWNAAVGALQDQGVQIVLADRPNGMLRGQRGGIDVTASVRSQADGSVRVQFDTAGATAQDPTLVQRISDAYDRRMGR